MIQEDLLQNELYYRARYIINHLPEPLDGVGGISANSAKHVHVMLYGNDELVLALARHIALVAHYPNFKETTGTNRTIITIVSPNISVDSMRATGMFGNLLSHCPVLDIDGQDMNQPNSCAYIDIAFQLIGQDADSYISSYQKPSSEILTVINASDECWQQPLAEVDKMVDVTSAQKVNLAYCAGQDLNNIDIADIANVHVYRRAINRYGFRRWNRHKCQTLWEACNLNYKLSSYYVSECLEGYKRSVCGSGKWSKRALYEALPVLAKTEHLRWCVAQLIAGFRPYSLEERCHYADLSPEDKKLDKKEKKQKNIHLDICSNKELKNLDYEVIKYDSLLLLVMPKIMK